MTGVVAVVVGLACYRVALLITADEITAPLRQRITRRLHGAGRDRVAYGLECPWCVSVWVSPVVVASGLWWSSGWGWWLIVGSLAASAVTGLLASVARP